MSVIENSPLLFDEAITSEKNESRQRTMVNHSLWFVDHAGVRVIFRWHEPLYRFPVSDVLMTRFVAVQLRLSGLATQEEVSGGFGHSEITQRRWRSVINKRGLKD